MTLDQRKEEVLSAVVEEYIRTARPVGSKTVARRGLGVSPATIRSEMNAMEEMGLLEQPHTSAGRIPTASGFRYYVDHLLPAKSAEQELIQKLEDYCARQSENPDRLIAGMAQALSELSHIVGMVMVVPAEKAVLKSIHFFEHGRGWLRVRIRHVYGQETEKFIKNEWNLDKSTLNRLNNIMEKIAGGLTLTELRRELIRRREEAKAQAEILAARAVELCERILQGDLPELIVTGQANLLDFPEFADLERIKQMMQTLEDKSTLLEMLETISLGRGVKVLIGEENMIESMKCCSVIASTYRRKDMTAGTLGVIGPTRMDYAKLIPLVSYSSDLLTRQLEQYT